MFCYLIKAVCDKHESNKKYLNKINLFRKDFILFAIVRNYVDAKFLSVAHFATVNSHFELRVEKKKSERGFKRWAGQLQTLITC